MTIRRFIAAILFAASLLSFAAAGFWYGIMTQAEKSIRDNISKYYGGEVQFSSLTWQLNPLQAGFNLHGVVARSAASENGISYTAELGEVGLVHDLLGDERLELSLPKTHNIKITFANGQTKNYTIMLEGASALFYPTLQRGEVIFNTRALTIFDKAKAKPLIRSGDVYMVISAEHSNVPGLRLSVNDAWLAPFGNEYEAKALLADFTPHNVPDFWRGAFIPALLSSSNAQMKQELTKLSYAAANNNGFIELHDFRLETPKRELAAHGKISINREVKPDFDLSITTSDFKWLLNELRHYGLVNDVLVRKNRLLGQTITQESRAKKPSINISADHGRASLNGVHSGVAKSLVELLK